MATITETAKAPGFKLVTEVTLDGSSDTFTYQVGHKQVLILRNDSGSTLTPVITAAGSVSAIIPGIGTIALNTGISQAIANNAVYCIVLDTIDRRLQGTISIASGSGLKCSLIQTV